MLPAAESIRMLPVVLIKDECIYNEFKNEQESKACWKLFIFLTRASRYVPNSIKEEWDVSSYPRHGSTVFSSFLTFVVLRRYRRLCSIPTWFGRGGGKQRSRSSKRLARENRHRTWFHITTIILEWCTASVRIWTTPDLSFERSLLILVLPILNKDNTLFRLNQLPPKCSIDLKSSYCSCYRRTNTSSGGSDLFSRSDKEHRKVRKRESKEEPSTNYVENIRSLRLRKMKRVMEKESRVLTKKPDSCYSDRQNVFF